MPRYKNLTPHERAFLKHRHEVLTLIPSVELTALLKDRNKVSSQPGVYIMWKKDSDHVYIGESVNVSRRLIEHATVNYPTQYIDRDIRKYGPEHFRVAFLEEVLDRTKRRQREGEYVSLFNSYHNGYNGSKDGNPMTQMQRTTRKWWRKLLKALFPAYVKAKRRKDSFRGGARLKRYARKLRKTRRS